MIFVFCLFFVRVKSLCCGYEYQTGTYTQFSDIQDPNFQCLNGNKFIGSITFDAPFTTIPQIMIGTLSYSFERNAQYSFGIITTTTTEWNFSIQCFGTSQLHVYQFTWIAVIDNRIYVINDFLNSNHLVDSFQSNQYTFPISGAKYDIKILITSYFGGSADVRFFKNGNQFSLFVSAGTSGLGVQIITGQTDCFYHQGFGGSLWFETNFPILVYGNYQIPVVGQYVYDEYSPTNNQAVRTFYLDDQSLANQRQVTAKAYGWGSFYYTVWVYDITTILTQPHILRKCRISKKNHIDYKMEVNFILTQLIDITDYNQIMNIENTSKTFITEANSLYFKYHYKCQPRSKLIVNTLRCKKDNQQQNYQLIQFCNKGIALMTMHFYLYQSQTSNSELIFKLTSQGFTLSEIIQDNTFTLVDISIQNQ